MSPENKPLNATPATGPEAEKSPAQIRGEIDRTRGELGDTVEALAERTDVRAQAKARVDDVKGQAKARVEEAKAKAEELGDKAREAAPGSPQEGMRQAQAVVRRNPRPAAIIGALLVLFLLWRWMRS